jgi:putative endonuclease
LHPAFAPCYFTRVKRPGFVYIITNTHHTVLYTGATTVLAGRITEHREKIFPKSFSSKYNLHKLIYYEYFDDLRDAFDREYQIKSWSRRKKEQLINAVNPDWKDLFDEIKDF